MTPASAEPSWKSLALHVWGPLAIAAPALAFPMVKPLASIVLIVIALAWCLIVSRSGPAPALTRRAIATPLNLPVLIIVALAMVCAAWSAYPEWSVPKLAGLLLGVLIGRATLLTATSPARIWQLTAVYAAFGVLIIVISALAGPQWRGLGSGYVQNLAGHVVPAVVTIPGAENGPNTNAIGGTTLFFLPLFVMLLWQWPDTTASGARRHSIRSLLIERGLWLLMLVLVSFVLLISQSRTSWLSALAVTAVLLAIRFRAIAIMASVVAICVIFAIAWFGPAATVQGFLARLSPYIGFFGHSDRPLIWRFAVEGIRSHPWGGVGLGAFREVIHGMTIDGATYSLPVPHAHNVFLQVALDLGVFGLVVYIALLALATRMTWQICHSQIGGRWRSATLGLWGALMAIHIFGLTDCIALGAKVGIFFWIHLAFISAIYRLPPGRQA